MTARMSTGEDASSCKVAPQIITKNNHLFTLIFSHRRLSLEQHMRAIEYRLELDHDNVFMSRSG